MRIDTKFNCGDSVYIITTTHDRKVVVGPYLIGKVSVEYTAAQAGPNPGSMFVNLGRQEEGYKEKYMCFETGVGSGCVYLAGDCFFTHDEAEAEIRRRTPPENAGSNLEVELHNIKS